MRNSLVRPKLFTVVLVLLGIGGILLTGIWLGRSSSQKVQAETLPPGYTVTLIPDQLILDGDVATQENTEGNCTEAWLDNMPSGSIILGVKPTSCNPEEWEGGSATAQIFLQDMYAPTVVVLKMDWPDQSGRGLRSPEKNRTGGITLDGRPIWSQRTTQLSAFGEYIGAEHEPMLTTMVLTQSVTHTLQLTVSAGTAWDISSIELLAYPYPSATKGIGYSPYRDCQYPGGVSNPSTQDLRDDLFRLFHTSNAIRTYAATGVNNQIPAFANEINLPVYAGAWIDYPKTTLAEDDAEIQALINLANTDDLAGVIVGNEYYLRHRSTEYLSYLVQRIQQVKAAIPANVPVTTAEIDNLMFDWNNFVIDDAYRSVLDEVDFVMVHIYPFWNGMPITGAADFTVNRYLAVQNLIEQAYPGQNKWVIIGEAGWPSAGAPNGSAMLSLENQRRYLIEFLLLAEQHNVDILYFDAFDELWKIEEPGRVGQNWGYSYSDRSAKHDLYGVLVPAEQMASLDPLPIYTSHIFLPYISRQASAIQPTFPVFTEWPMGAGHFVPSGWMGDIENIEMYECDRTQPHSGDMAVRIAFSPTGTLGWGGVYWQYPENNWGDQPEGLDLSWANRLTFWAKGESGGEKIRFFAGGIGTANDPYPDSLRPEVSTGFITLSNQWQQYTINLYGQDLSHVIGGFGWATDLCANPQGTTFYLDDIVYAYDPALQPPPPPGPVFAVYTDAGTQDNHYIPGGWMGDATVPGRVSFTECWDDNPHSGQTSIRADYSQQVIGWAGVYWLHPDGNWGDRPGGYDLTGADRVTFWARSDTPNAKVKFLIGGIGYAVDNQGNAICSVELELYPDSVCPKIEYEVTLSPTWTKYIINIPPDRELWRVVGGFGWVADEEVIFYLDDIVYEFD